MVEYLFNSARIKMGKPAMRLMGWISAGRRLGFLLAGLALIFVGFRYFWVGHENERREEITRAFCSINPIYGAPQVSPDGRWLLYVAASDGPNRDLVLADLVSGHKQVVERQSGLWSGTGLWGSEFSVQPGPWAPDESAFIYFTAGRLIIQPIEDDRLQKQVPIGVQGITNAVWLNPAQFAYVASRTRIGCAQKMADGRWVCRDGLQFGAEINSLTAAGRNSVAWLADGVIFHADLAGLAAGGEVGTNRPVVVAPVPVLEPPTNGLTLWLDASRLQQDDQTPVCRLMDLSPSHNDAVPNGQAPVFNAPGGLHALGGRGTIHFTSSSAGKNASGLKTQGGLGIIGAMPRTVFAVMRREAGPNLMRIGMGTQDKPGAYFGVCAAPMGIYLPEGFGSNGFVTSPANSQWNLLEVLAAGDCQKGYFNSALCGASDDKLDTADKALEIGLRTGPHPQGSDGDFAELIVYNRELGFNERRQVEAYLKRKWFGLSLPDLSPWLWVDPPGVVTGIVWDRASRQLLLSGVYDNDGLLQTLNPESPGEFRTMKVPSFESARWLDQTNCAFLHRVPGGRTAIALADLTRHSESSMLECSHAVWFQPLPGSNQLLMFGTVADEPAAGIWQRDLDTGHWQSVVSCFGDTPEKVQTVNRFQAGIQLPSGRVLNCSIYPPPNFDRHKKYPLLLGDTQFGVVVNGAHGRFWVQDVAACGAFVVFVNRETWFGGIEKWEQEVRGVYEHLINDPCLDASQVYLFGASAETPYLSQCIEKTPGLWKGAIFLNPTALPHFSRSSLLASPPKILISAGGLEHEEDRFKQFQMDALQSGVMVEYSIAPGETHHFVGNAAQTQRTEDIMRFIFEK